MKSNRWWLKGITHKVFRKYYRHMGQDGMSLTLEEWDKILTECRSLKPGDLIWNLHTKDFSKIKEVNFIWRPCNFYYSKKYRGEFFRRVPGAAVFEFRIITEEGHTLYDSPSWAKIFAKHSGDLNEN